jgi:hypothetical protein
VKELINKFIENENTTYHYKTSKICFITNKLDENITKNVANISFYSIKDHTN